MSYSYSEARAFNAHGRAGLCFLENTMNSEHYIQVLDEYFLTFMNIHRQDGAPCHSSRKIETQLQEKNIEVFPWPGNGPDLNPMENLWVILKKKVFEMNCTSIEDLKNTLRPIRVTDCCIFLSEEHTKRNFYQNVKQLLLCCTQSQTGFI